MINNWLRLSLAAAALHASVGCTAARSGVEEPSQGVVEYEERTLGFEVGGKLTAVPVARGDRVTDAQLLARLDDELVRASRAARASEADAARAQAALLEAGSRPEEIRSMAARVRAAAAVEAQLRKNLERERTLAGRGVTPQALVDDLESQLSRATAERQSLEQNLSALKRGARSQEVAAAEARAEAARASLKLEEARLARHELRSEGAGQVLDVHAEQGEIVSPGAPVVTIADVRRPYADVFVPEAEMGGLRLNGSAEVRVDALPDALPAKIESIGRRAEFTPRFLFSERERPNLVIRVRVRIDDGGERLHAGLPAFVRFARQP